MTSAASDVSPIEAHYFRSLSGATSYIQFFAKCPPGTKIEAIFKPEFWSNVATASYSRDNLHVDDLIRLRSPERTFDVMVVVIGLREDRTPILKRWPIDPQSAAASARPPFAIPRTRSEACDVLGVNPNAGDDIVRKLGDALRLSWHPDQAADEVDREMREARMKLINAAIDVLSGKRKAA